MSTGGRSQTGDELDEAFGSLTIASALNVHEIIMNNAYGARSKSSSKLNDHFTQRKKKSIQHDNIIV